MAPATPSQPVVHLELRTPNLPGACALYGELCGWRPERIVARGGSYTALGIGSGTEIDGGVVETESGRPLWLPYAQVPEISAATQRARELGANVLLEPREGPAGWRSVISTAAGGELAFWQSKPAVCDEFQTNGRSLNVTGNENTGGDR